MKLYGAIDLHPNNNVTVVIDEQDRVVYQKRLPNDLPLITQQLSAYLNLRGSSWNRPSTGTGWSTVLWTRGHRVHLADTASIQQYEGLKYTKNNQRAGSGPPPAICL